MQSPRMKKEYDILKEFSKNVSVAEGRWGKRIEREREKDV